MKPRITFITLGVSDLPKSVRFFRDGLGFPTSAKDGAPIAIFMTMGVRLALYPKHSLAADISPKLKCSQSGFGGITLGHNVEKKEEVAKILALAKKAGGKIVKPAQDTFWGGHSGYFTDLDGYYWEVAWAPMFGFDETGALIFNDDAEEGPAEPAAKKRKKRTRG
jgi:predicted lactoylglutathione lyase